MPICPHCQEPFTYKQLLPFAWKPRVGIHCTNCQNTSYNSASMKKKATLIVFIFPTLVMLKELFNIPFQIMYIIFLVVVIALIFSLPLAVKPTKEEEPLW